MAREYFHRGKFISQLEMMRSDKRTLHKRTYLLKKNGVLGRQRRCLELSPYEYMLQKQGGVCKICKGTNASGRSLAIDHDHETDEVRGLLCWKCNSGLGLFGDSSARLLEAAKYLKEHGK